MQTDELVAGHKLDALVAEKVMGWEHDTGGWWWTGPNRESQLGLNASREDWEAYKRGELKDWDRAWLPDFSSDIAVAWQIVEHMHANGYNFSIAQDRHSAVHVSFGQYDKVGESFAPSAPLAICRAALAALA